MREWSTGPKLAFLMLSCFACDALGETQYPQPVLAGLGERLAIAAEAPTLAGLQQQLKPNFAWDKCCMMWVRENPAGKPEFTMDRAYVYQPKGEDPKWVVLEARDAPFDEMYAQVMGYNLKAVAPVLETKPTGDNGSGDYAIVLSHRAGLGTVYEIGWQDLLANGTSLAETERRLYVLKDSGGKYRFIGEGPGEGHGKNGYLTMFAIRQEARVTWAKDSQAPCRIDFMVETKDDQWSSGDDPPGFVPKRTKVEYEDMTLDADSKTAIGTGKGRYVVAGKEDNLNTITELLASWTTGWEPGKPGERQKILEKWRSALRRLNPELDRIAIEPGAKVRIAER